MGTRYELFKILKKFGVNIIGIPITNDWDKLKEMIDLCDGLVLPGGESFTSNDFKLVRYLYDNDIPTLGICLGMQAMGETFNGKKEIKVLNHYSKNKYVHEVLIDRNSLLYEILKKDKILVNSRHNYVIYKTDFKVNAISEEGKIEGIEDTKKKFFLGVQWHPESINDKNSYRIFRYFINVL